MNSKRSVSVLCRFFPPRCTLTQQPLVICAPSRHRFVSCRAFSSNSLFPKKRALSIVTREKSPLLFHHRSYSASSASSSSAPSPPLLCVTPPQIPIWRKVWNDCRSNPWQLAGHMGFILALSSFMVTDMLWLRTLSICASISGLTYNFMVRFYASSPFPPSTLEFCKIPTPSDCNIVIVVLWWTNVSGACKALVASHLLGFYIRLSERDADHSHAAGEEGCTIRRRRGRALR